MNTTISIITLGCSKNIVDSEHVAGQLRRGGWRVAFDPERVEGGVVVVNTCGFIGDAKQESVDTILEWARARQQGLIERLFVIGCLSERYAEELREEIPEVDDFFGARGIQEIVEALEVPYNECVYKERALSTPRHYAYLKISEGCDRKCSFCAIPFIRGGHVSVPVEQLLEETRALAAQGVKELIVIAQDTTVYGVDLYGRRALAELLRGLCAVEGIEWVRLLYAYPAGFPDDVLEVMRTEPKMCKYIDIPLQHIADTQLKSMKRAVDGAATRALVDRLRREVPGIAIRTTMMVGFPGETEAEFEQLLEFVREASFDRLGVFTYSEEEGTWAGENLADDVPEEVKQLRAERLIDVQSAIAEDNNLAMVGTVQRVIIDGRQEDDRGNGRQGRRGGLYLGRTQWDTPEVDQEVLIASVEPLAVGQFCDVHIDRAGVYEIYGTVVEKK